MIKPCLICSGGLNIFILHVRKLRHGEANNLTKVSQLALTPNKATDTVNIRLQESICKMLRPVHGAY